MSSKVGTYDHLNEEPVAVTVNMDELAQIVIQQNYGLHRFLSAIIRIRRAERALDIQRYKDRGDHDVARYVEVEGDALVDAIEGALNAGCF